MKDEITDYIEENSFETTYIWDKSVEALASISLRNNGKSNNSALWICFGKFLDSIPNSADILYVVIKKQDVISKDGAVLTKVNDQKNG